MRYYVITGIAIGIIFLVVAALWFVWGINLEDFITGLGLILAATILPMCWWAYNKERDAKQHSVSAQRTEKPKLDKDGYRHPTFSGIETNPDKMDPELRRKREDDWRFFPSNYK